MNKEFHKLLRGLGLPIICHIFHDALPILIFFVQRSMPGGQPFLKSIIKTREKEEANKLVARCFLWSDNPFNITKNNPFYHSMFEAAAIVGPRYKGPTYNDLRGHVLQVEKIYCTKRLVEIQDSWKITRGSVMSDST